MDKGRLAGGTVVHYLHVLGEGIRQQRVALCGRKPSKGTTRMGALRSKWYRVEEPTPVNCEKCCEIFNRKDSSDAEV